jgi:hypothetical protein
MTELSERASERRDGGDGGFFCWRLDCTWQGHGMAWHGDAPEAACLLSTVSPCFPHTITTSVEFDPYHTHARLLPFLAGWLGWQQRQQQQQQT